MNINFALLHAYAITHNFPARKAAARGGERASGGWNGGSLPSTLFLETTVAEKGQPKAEADVFGPTRLRPKADGASYGGRELHAAGSGRADNHGILADSSFAGQPHIARKEVGLR